MPSLSASDDRFGTRLVVIEGGSGEFKGILAEPGQGDVPAFQFNLPRRLLRVEPHLPLAPGMVLKTEMGSVYMVGRHGDSEQGDGTLFRTYRLFEAERQFTWLRRSKVIDPVTRLARDTGKTDKGLIWGAFEPSPEMFDRQLRSSFETGRFITNADVQEDDIVNDMKVSRVDMQLGLRLVALG